jgi:hypothetical protein
VPYLLCCPRAVCAPPDPAPHATTTAGAPLLASPSEPLMLLPARAPDAPARRSPLMPPPLDPPDAPLAEPLLPLRRSPLLRPSETAVARPRTTLPQSSRPNFPVNCAGDGPSSPGNRPPPTLAALSTWIGAPPRPPHSLPVPRPSPCKLGVRSRHGSSHRRSTKPVGRPGGGLD